MGLMSVKPKWILYRAKWGVGEGGEEGVYQTKLVVFSVKQNIFIAYQAKSVIFCIRPKCLFFINAKRFIDQPNWLVNVIINRKRFNVF